MVSTTRTGSSAIASNKIVAVTSFGMNSYCKGVDFSYRMDRKAVIDWIYAHVPEGQASKIRIVKL